MGRRLGWLLLMCACTGGKGDDATSPGTSTTIEETTPSAQPFVPVEAELHRLTSKEYRNATEALLGERWEGELPVDYVLHGYASVGSGDLAISPLDLEQYESAAWSLANKTIDSPEAVEALLGCPYDAVCLGEWMPGFLQAAWRRPSTLEERHEMVMLAEGLNFTYDSEIATKAVIAAVLQSPDFLFRVEVGTPDPEHPGRSLLTDWELAAKLSFFLIDGPPDDELMRAAEAGELRTGGLEAQVVRLLRTPAARVALTDWFDETLELERIEGLDKDTELYPELPELQHAMRVEIREMFATLALDEAWDVRDLFTTNLSFTSPELTETIYGFETTGVAPQRVNLPADQERGGILGRSGLLAIGAHNTVTSPTHRGKLVRTRLLCQDIPPPPPGVVTELSDNVDEASLRERLEAHAVDPACVGCHELMDPIGYGLEFFDPIGRHRTSDNGFAIDASGDLDGVTFDGAESLGEAVANHPELPSCLALQIYRHSQGHSEEPGELPAVASLSEVFVEGGHEVEALVVGMVTSEAFLSVATAVVEPCTDGDSRECASSCGDGVESCVDGEWMACDAPEPAAETCDGIDEDCDGLVDENLVLPCVTEWGDGEQTCVDGEWAECEGPPEPIEICNGIDDDGNGLIDEDLEVAWVPQTHADLTTSHPDCQPAVDTFNGPCNAAVHRICQADACAVSGFGPVEVSSTAPVTCLDDTEAVVVGTSFTELGGQHPDCSEANTHGGSCNAAISRLCSSLGHTTGFGPVEHGGDAATVVCTPQATVINASYTDLSTYEPLCNEFGERWGMHCSAAIAAYCIDEGYESGHGPLENTGDLAIIACLGTP